MNDIRFHIKSIKQTRQITNAMYLVSASRMRKALKRIEQNRAYFYRALDTMKDIRMHTHVTSHPYLIHREGGNKIVYIVIAGDKGLAGSYNHDVLALADESMKGKNVTRVFPIGNMAAAHFQRKGMRVNTNFTHIVEEPSVNTARRMVMILMSMYDEGIIDELHVVYTRFENSLLQKPMDVKLLPVELSDFQTDRDEHEYQGEMLYLPSAKELFDVLVPQFIIGYTYGAIIHAYASENRMRMTAMENATRSADEMTDKLTLKYNTMRQLSITNELAEIVGAANAFEIKG